MSLKIRVLALASPVTGTPISTLVYHAEAYEEDDQFRDPKWSCRHRHDSAQEAHECGLDWLAHGIDRVSRSK